MNATLEVKMQCLHTLSLRLYFITHFVTFLVKSPHDCTQQGEYKLSAHVRCCEDSGIIKTNLIQPTRLFEKDIVDIIESLVLFFNDYK